MNDFKNMELSEYFKLGEFEHSETACKHGIDNTIPYYLIPAVTRLHDNILFPLRKNLGHPVIITSGYRCKSLNKLVSNAPNSQHTKGEAADITVRGQSNLAVFNWIRKHCEFDQLILEQTNGVQWVHVSYVLGRNRKQCLSFDGKQYKAI